MKKILIVLTIFILAIANLSTTSVKKADIKNCKATYYDTKGHPIVHRSFPTAAYYHWKYLNMKLVITNIKNNVIDTVIVTDRHGMGTKHVDLSHLAFDRLAKLDTISNLKKRDRIRKSIGVLNISIKIIK